MRNKGISAVSLSRKVRDNEGCVTSLSQRVRDNEEMGKRGRGRTERERYKKSRMRMQPAESLEVPILPPLLGGDGELLASVAAAGSQHATAVGGTHALAEAMLVDALAVRRLECSFHYLNFYILFDNRTAKVVFFNLNDKFFLKIFQRQPTVHPPGSYTPLFQAIAPHELGDLRVDVTALEIEDTVAETVTYPGVEIVPGGDCPRYDKVVDSGQGLGPGVDDGDVAEPEGIRNCLSNNGLFADAVAEGELHPRKKDRQRDAGKAAAGADV